MYDWSAKFFLCNTHKTYPGCNYLVAPKNLFTIIYVMCSDCELNVLLGVTVQPVWEN